MKTSVTLAVIVGLAGIGATASGAATTTPTLKVTPSTGLADTQNVTVSGTGFGANATAITIECPTGATDVTTCDFATFIPAFADPSGAFSLTRPVRRLISGFPSTVDCALATCEIGVTDGTTILAHANISFDPKIPPVLPKIKVTPATGLQDHQLVSVAGSGFDPGAFVALDECLASDPTTCAFETDHTVSAAQDGTFTARTIAVERKFETFDSTTGNPITVDCAKSAKTCVMTAGGGPFGGGVPSTFPLQFDPSVPAVVAKITVKPATALGDLQDITVKGSGFLPGATVHIEECAGTDIGLCGPFPATVTAGFTGVFTSTFSVRRLLPVFTFLGLRVVDCATSKTKCAVLVDDGGRDAVSTNLAFTTTKPPVSSALLAFPRSGLLDNSRIRVGFAGFSAYQPVTLIECTAQALAEEDTSYCDPNTQLTTTTPAFGPVPTATFFAKRVLETGNGLVDCKAKPGSCILLAISQGNGYSGGVVNVGAQRAAASTHPSRRAAASLPENLNRQTLRAAASAKVPGIATLSLSFGS